MSTADILDKLAADDVLGSAFDPNMAEMVISCLIDLPQFVPIAYLKPEHFPTPITQWVAAAYLSLNEKYDASPTRAMLRSHMLQNVYTDQPYEEILTLIDRQCTGAEVQYVRERYIIWAKHEAYSKLCGMEAAEALQRRDYSQLESLIAAANALGGEAEGEPFGFTDAADFLGEEINIEWLVDGLLVKDQPCIVGGKDKCLKTGTVCDLAISLATGTPFLGHFAVPKPRRVAFVSAESGKMDIKRRFAAVLNGKGIRAFPKDTMMISFERPQLSSGDDLAKLGQAITKYKAEVVIIDPLYLTLLAGDDSGTSASDLYGMGSKFGALADVIAKAGATAILVHHYKKTTEEGTLGLNEFTFTGASAFARQSLHIGRRRPYSGPTTNQMRFQNHGFASGCTYNLDINEETWECHIEPEGEAIVRATVTRANNDATELVNYLKAEGRPMSKNKIREGLKWNDPKVRAAITASGGQVEEVLDQGKRLYQAR